MPKVLLIDDSRTIHKVVGLILKGTPYHLLTSDEPEQGFQLACREKPEIILIDYTIGQGNGLELMKRISLVSDLKQSRSALLYGHFQKVDEEALRKAGGVAKLSKPFDSDEFLKLIEELTNLSNPPKVVCGPSDDFQSLFDDEELEACLDFLEKPLTPKKEKKIPRPMIIASDSDTEVKISQDVSKAAIEKVCWEVIPPLAERIIREEIEKLLKEQK